MLALTRSGEITLWLGPSRPTAAAIVPARSHDQTPASAESLAEAPQLQVEKDPRVTIKGVVANTPKLFTTPRGTPKATFHLALHQARTQTLAVAYALHPERFVRKAPVPPPLPTAAWINQPGQREEVT